MSVTQVKRILVFRRGLLGDNIVAVPALRALREAFPNAHIVLVSEVCPNSGIPCGEIVFGESSLVDQIIGFAAYNASRITDKLSATIDLVTRLRKESFDTACALDRGDKVRWEPWLASFLGVRNVIYPRDANSRRTPASGGPLPVVSHVADELLDILQPLGITTPGPGLASMDLNINAAEAAQTEEFLREKRLYALPAPWVALAPWSNMPSKEWPIDRYVHVMLELQKKIAYTPYIFGGEENRKASKELVNLLGFGVPVAGALNVRQSIALMRMCKLYLGNDCGAMHMAVSAGLRCVAIFSARDQPGLWYPYGFGHVVLRKYVPCEGCFLRECSVHGNKCTLATQPSEVLEAVLAILNSFGT